MHVFAQAVDLWSLYQIKLNQKSHRMFMQRWEASPIKLFNSGASVQTVCDSGLCLHEIHMFWRMNTHREELFSFYLNRTALKINGLLLSWGTNGSAWPASVFHCCWIRTKDPQAALPCTALCSQHRPLTPMLSCYTHTHRIRTQTRLLLFPPLILCH